MAKKPVTEAGAALEKILSERGVSQYRVSKLSGLSQPYVNQVATGRRRASAEWIELIANALQLTPEEREALHRAAARDHGFKIDLTKP